MQFSWNFAKTQILTDHVEVLITLCLQLRNLGQMQNSIYCQDIAWYLSIKLASHTTGRHGKPNHRACQWQLLENNFASTLHILQVLHGWVGGHVWQWQMAKQILKPYIRQEWAKTLRTPVPRLPAVCEKKVFGFFHSPQPMENHTSVFLDMHLLAQILAISH